MTLKQYIDKNNLTINAIARNASVTWDAVVNCSRNNATSSQKLNNWCEEQGITLGVVPKKPENKNDNGGDRGRPKVNDPVAFHMTHMYKIRKGLVAVKNRDCERFHKRIIGSRIHVKVDRKRPCSVIYNFEVIG